MSLMQAVIAKNRYLNKMDKTLLNSIKDSVSSFFTNQQRNYIIVFSVFITLMILGMVLLSYYGVEYLFKNLIAIKFILNFIPG